MRLVLLTSVAAALSLIGAAGAQAQTVYATDPPAATVVDNPAVVATTPGYVYAVPAPPFGPFTPQYIVTRPTVVVAPSATVAPRERVIERERVIVSRPARGAKPRERVVERERVLVEPREQVVVQPREQAVVAPRETGIVTTGSASSCFVDLNGFERCY
jgi:hypothetical protein